MEGAHCDLENARRLKSTSTEEFTASQRKVSDYNRRNCERNSYAKGCCQIAVLEAQVKSLDEANVGVIAFSIVFY